MTPTPLFTSSVVLCGVVLLSGLIGCERDDEEPPVATPSAPTRTIPESTLGERVGTRMNNAGDALQRGAERTGDAIDNAVDATGDAVSRAGAELRAATQPTTLPR